jgi:predicted ribosome quality control (RQC) complex YloA/Tae2 family protein
MDFEIRVGKNAKANDELLRISHKDDLWLHARDVPGSHVLVKTKKGKNTPQPVIQRAAELAAHYSRASGEKLVPVMLTERKYVRKIKGSAAGLVKVEREKTILVEPSA